MRIQQLVLGRFATNCYLITGSVPGKCILIDPADEAGLIIRQLLQQQLQPEAVILTHGHYDHFLAVPELQKRWKGMPVYCHPLDCPKELTEYDMGRVFPTVTALKYRRMLADGQRLLLAGLDIEVLHTPGHTRGSVTLVIGNVLFTGDTLFRESIGRTDFAGGSGEEMADSLRLIASLSGDYKIYPGHDSLTSLNHERSYNTYLLAALKKDT